MNKKLKLSVLLSHNSLYPGKQNKSSKDFSESSKYFDNDISMERNVNQQIDTEEEEKYEIRKDAQVSVTHKNEYNVQSEPYSLSEVNKRRRKKIKITYEDTSDSLQVLTLKDATVKDECANIEDIRGEEATWVPPNWYETLNNIETMRQHRTAPVDSMGCHRCSDPNATARISRYQSLIALMLSSQTKDQVTHAAMQRLNTYGCTPELIAATPNDVLGKLIYPVGFWKRKVEYIRRTSTILLAKYNGDIPNTLKGLCDLPGVGPKMAHICMQIAWGEVSGIGVDTHVHRICNRLKWVRQHTRTPEETRNCLEDWLPKELWSKINHLLVGFGQEICLPRFPKCNKCLNKDICPFVTESERQRK